MNASAPLPASSPSPDYAAAIKEAGYIPTEPLLARVRQVHEKTLNGPLITRCFNQLQKERARAASMPPAANPGGL